jgi:hypothetical protein
MPRSSPYIIKLSRQEDQEGDGLEGDGANNICNILS